ncbi:MAG TPA: S8 family peptidase, partial [Terriglobia bacterium]|nr:S8 family peptidase [Terriglobia bacterium]
MNRTSDCYVWSRLGLLLLSFLVGVPVFAQQPEIFNGRPAMREEILVRLRSADSASLARAQNAAPFGRIHSLSPGLGLHLIRAPGNSVAGLMRAFANHPDVLYAEPNYLVQTAVTNPNDSLLASLWGIEKIQAPLAWDTSTGGASAVVGVVDTGVDYNHPDLAANMWRAPTAFSVTIQGVPVICPAGSYGFNAINFSCDPRDDHNHGTHVSGTIGATGNNGLGVVGVNWRAQMMGLKFMNANVTGTVSAAINAIEFAIQVKARFAGTATPVDVRVLSNSWSGNGFSQSLLDQINKANANDMLFVAAAGNSGGNNDQSPAYPAAFSTVAPNVIAVAATDASDTLASFSNYGPGSVQLGAPGVGIYSTLRGGGYANFSGTSMAAPHVAGAALLTLAACPSLRTPELKSAILANTDPLSGLAGVTTTGGRLNADRLVRSCLPPSSSLQATFLGVTGEDFVGPGTQSTANGVTDWHIQLAGLRAVPDRVEVTSASGGVWRGPGDNTGTWVVAAQYSGNSGHLWFEPWATAEFRVRVWYADGSTDAVNVTNAAVPGTLAATFLGVTGEDFVRETQPTPNGVGDWHIQLAGLRAVPVRVEVTSVSGGVWRGPGDTTGTWVVAAHYSGNSGH